MAKKSVFFSGIRLFSKKFSVLLQHWQNIPSYLPIFIALTVIIVCLGAVYLVDIQDIFGVPYTVRRFEGLYTHLFNDLRPVQLMQIGYLSLIILGSVVLFDVFNENGKVKERNFWGLVALSFLIMFIEDAANPRHVLVHYTSLLNIPRELIEGPFYLLMALPLLIALIRYRSVIFPHFSVKRFFIVGVLVYAVASVASLFREVWVDFYQIWGTKLTNVLTGGVIPGYGLMDLLVEESLELMAVSIIFTGVLIYWKSFVSTNKDDNSIVLR